MIRLKKSTFPKKMPANTSTSNTTHNQRKYSSRIHGKLGPKVSDAHGVSFYNYNRCVGYRQRYEAWVKYWELVKVHDPLNFSALAYKNARNGVRRWQLKADAAEIQIDKINGKVPVHSEVREAQRQLAKSKAAWNEVKANCDQMDQWKQTDPSKYDAKKNKNLKAQLNRWTKKISRDEDKLVVITEEKKKISFEETMSDTSQNYLYKKYFDDPNFDCGINLSMLESTLKLDGLEGEDLDRELFDAANTDYILKEKLEKEELKAKELEEAARIEQERAEAVVAILTHVPEPVYKVMPSSPVIPEDDEERSVTEWWYYTFGSGYTQPLGGRLTERREFCPFLGNHYVEYFLPSNEVKEDKIMTYGQWKKYMKVMELLARNITIADRLGYVEVKPTANFKYDTLDDKEEELIEVEEIKTPEPIEEIYEDTPAQNLEVKIAEKTKNTLGDILTKVLQKKTGKRLTEEQTDAAQAHFSKIFQSIDSLLNREMDKFIAGKYLDEVKSLNATNIPDQEEEFVFTFGMDSLPEVVVPYIEPQPEAILETIDLDQSKKFETVDKDSLTTASGDQLKMGEEKKCNIVNKIMNVKESLSVDSIAEKKKCSAVNKILNFKQSLTANSGDQSKVGTEKKCSAVDKIMSFKQSLTTNSGDQSKVGTEKKCSAVDKILNFKQSLTVNSGDQSKVGTEKKCSAVDKIMSFKQSLTANSGSQPEVRETKKSKNRDKSSGDTSTPMSFGAWLTG